MIHFFLVVDRWTTTHMPLSGPTDGSVAMGCTVLAFRPCSGTCFTVSATQGLPSTVVARTMSSDMDAVRSMWTSRLTLPTRAGWPSSPRPPVMTSMTPWRGLLTRPSQSSVSTTCQALLAPPSPYSLFKTGATRRGASACQSVTRVEWSRLII
jgi:hypothetical protein